MPRFFIRKKNILHIINSLEIGGAENILFNIINKSNKKDTIIISLTFGGVYGKQLIKKGYKVYELNMRKDLLFLFNFIRLVILIIKHNPRIVHTWMYHSNLIGGIAAKLSGVKNIIWSIHHDFECSNIFMLIEMRILAFLSYLIPNKIVYCSSSSKENHNSNGYKNNISLIINNGVSTSKFKPNINFRKKIRRELRINEDYLLLGNISRYHPIKDHDTLLKSLVILNKYNLNYKCILIGKGLSKQNINLLKKINHLKLQDRIILHGVSTKVHEIINAFDLNILSSKSESSPVTLLESMSCGVPSICTAVGDSKNIIGDSGWVVEAGNPKEMADCIYHIFKQKILIKTKSKLAIKRVKNFYSLEKMNYKYKNLYR